jgi:uncharacterized membrane protein
MNDANKEAATGRVKLLLAALKAEVGENEELLKQAFEDSNALERQGQRNVFESRIEYGRLIGQALLTREASVKEYGLQTLRWACLLNAGAIALIAAYFGARTGNRSIYSLQSLSPVIAAVWPFALGCILVVAAGAAGYFNFSYSTWLLPSYEAIHNFYDPTSGKWPDPVAKLDTETIDEFRKRIYRRLGRSQRFAVYACASSLLCLLVGVWQVIANLS